MVDSAHGVNGTSVFYNFWKPVAKVALSLILRVLPITKEFSQGILDNILDDFAKPY